MALSTPIFKSSPNRSATAPTMVGPEPQPKSPARASNANIAVPPVRMEFDASIIYTDKNNKYKPEEKYLYYVACTRSQHYLIIYNQDI